MQLELWQLALAWTLVYTALSMGAARRGYIPDSLTTQGPLTLVHTARGLDAVDRIAARYPRLWAVWGRLGVGVFFVGLVGGTALLLVSAVRIVSQPGSAPLAADPQNILVIPGVNEYLPLAAAPALVTALAIAMVVHELGHAIYCRVGDIEIDSSGLVLLALLPAGAFVEPDEESQRDASRWHRLQMVSAGVMNNVGATAVALAVLVLIVPSVIAPAPGVAVGGVLPESPADEAGLEKGDRIVGLNGTEIASQEAFESALRDTPSDTVSLSMADGTAHRLDRRVFVSGSAVSDRLEPGATITAVAGEPVATTDEYHEQLRAVERQVVPVTLATGEEVSQVAGVRAKADSEAAAGNYPTNESFYLTAVDGSRVLTPEDVKAVLSATEDGARVPVTGLTLADGTIERFETVYAVAEDDDALVATAGVGGVSTVSVGVEPYPAEEYLGYITGENSVLAALFFILFLPFGTLGGLPFNFAGVTPTVSGFYQVAEPLSAVAPAVVFGVSLAFWTVWININLALFNCLPTFALDGGHYARYALEELAARLGYEEPKQASQTYARALMVVLLVGIAAVVAIPPLFG
jgi:membrane-associated protease RseP (regulator of RpoE activity)